MNESLSRIPKLDLGGYGFDHDDLPSLGATPGESRFDFRVWFPADRRDRRLELEIGSGKGTFLVQQAPLTPDTNYLGVEWAGEFYRYAADRVRRRTLPNVRLLHTDARTFVTWYCDDAIFSVVHIYFPDPWPKKRHHKRRTVCADFLRELHRVLGPGGEVRVVTDHDEYFAWMGEHVAMVGDLFDRGLFEPPAAGSGEVVGTNFERKYRREGRPFNAMTLTKK